MTPPRKRRTRPAPRAPDAATDSTRSTRTGGYRVAPGPGPRLRADVVEVHIAQRLGRGIRLLQIRRARNPLAGTWQPVMGHIEAGELAPACALRELREEVSLHAAAIAGFWALEQVHPFYIATIDSIVLSPRFLALAKPGWTPTLNEEHTAWRWVAASAAGKRFMWPGQWAAANEVVALLRGPRTTLDALAIDSGSAGDRPPER